MIVATAGHIDHGKSALIEALTGTDPMHLPEEKKRGMTIDIGFAFLPLPNGERLAFVDVPGHEKFLSNMLVGVGGVRHALLVIACDDGVMPQTREHLAILKLLHMAHLIVALTKADRVSAGLLHEREQEIRHWLSDEGFPQPTLFVTAAPTGLGIAELRDHLMTLVDAPDTAHRFRLPIDRVFYVKGAGLVVTGTALAGSVRVDDTLWLTGANQPVRVRSLHAQNQPTQVAHAGQRVALNLTAARLEKESVTRGDWLLAEEPPDAMSRVLVVLEPDHTPLKPGLTLTAHHGARHSPTRLALLDDYFAELIFEQPFYLADNDRLILRDNGRLFAGARVVALAPPRRGKRQPEYLAWLKRCACAGNDQQALTHALEHSVVSVPAFAWARQLSNEAMDALVDRHPGLIRLSGLLFTQTQVAQRCQRLLEVLAAAHQQTPDVIGIGQARWRRMALPNDPAPLVEHCIARLLAEQKIVNSHGWLHLPEHRLSFSEREQQLWQRALPAFDQPPCWVRDLAERLALSEDEARALLIKAARLGLITAIVRDRYYLSQQLVHFASLIRNGQANNAAALRDVLGIGRKLAIQILEYFDRCGFTRRIGDNHVVRDAELFQATEKE